MILLDAEGPFKYDVKWLQFYVCRFTERFIF